MVVKWTHCGAGEGKCCDAVGVFRLCLSSGVSWCFSPADNCTKVDIAMEQGLCYQ